MDIDQILTVESNRISEEMHNRTLHQSVWLDMVQKGTWEDEMGQTISVLTYESSVPASPTAWSNVTFNTGSGNSCVPAADQIAFAQTLRTYNLAQKALEGPPICVNDLRFTFKRQKQLENCYAILADNSKELWANRHRDEYVRLATHKVICKSGYPESSASFPLQEPTSRLTKGALNRVYLQLIRIGAARDGGSVAMEDGAPVFVAIMSPETDEVLITEDYQVREDFRNTDRAPELLKALGITRSYKGFYHVIDHQCPRYNFTGGAWVRVPFYDLEATTTGDMAIVNPDYETADYEDTIIFLPSVYKCLIPRPITTPGGGTEFDPQTYMGDWKWLNIQDRVENPDKNWGYYRGIFSSGSEPVYPQFGYVLRHKRANIEDVFIDENGDIVEA